RGRRRRFFPGRRFPVGECLFIAPLFVSGALCFTLFRFDTYEFARFRTSTKLAIFVEVSANRRWRARNKPSTRTRCFFQFRRPRPQKFLDQSACPVAGAVVQPAA